MRICGGLARGITLRVSKSGGVRPAMEPARERLFSSIGSRLHGSKILDLFAGSGSYGLEALSRGAEAVTFVEKSRKVFYDLQKNFAAVTKSARLDDSSGKLINRDVIDFLGSPSGHSYDLIFLDPPYREIERIYQKVFSLLAEGKWINREGVVILECPGEMEVESPGWQMQRVLGKEKRGSPVHRIYSVRSFPPDQ